MEKRSYTTLNHRKMNKTSCASLVNRIEANADGLDSKEWQDDEQFMALWNEMCETTSEYQIPIGQVRKKQQTTTLEEAVSIRHRAYMALRRANNVFAVSEIEAEKTAHSMIENQFKALRMKTQKNRENEKTNLNVLIDKLRSNELAPYVALLKLDSFVTRLESANNLYSSTEQTGTMKKIHAKEIPIKADRDTLMYHYQLVVNYVQAMSSLGKEPFKKLFDAIDEAREYFARDIAYRETLRKNKKKESSPVTAPKVA